MQEAQYAILNDEELQDFSVLLLQEPACFKAVEERCIAPPNAHTHWAQHMPSRPELTKIHPIRSLIYVNRSLRARQIEIPSKDVTAVELQIQSRRLLIFSVYIPPAEGPAARDRATIDETLRLVEQARVQHPTHEVFVGGDFNRHDQL